MPPVGQSPPSLTASQRLCVSPAFKTEPGVQDFGEGLAVFSGAHAMTSAHSLSLCSAPTGTQTGLWLEQCHCRGPLPFINRSLRGRFSRRQLLLPPARFYALREVQSELAALLCFSARRAVRKGSSAAPGCVLQPGPRPQEHQEGLGPAPLSTRPRVSSGSQGAVLWRSGCLF